MHLKTLGVLALEGSDFRRPKPLLLLTYLALEGTTSRREIADLFFASAKSPRDSLSTALRYLKKVSPDIVVPRGTHLETWVACDATDLLRSLDEQRHARAVASYGGPFLKGLDLHLLVELEEWVFATRELLASRVREAYVKLAEDRDARGDAAEAGRLAERACGVPGAPELEPQALTRLLPMLACAGSPLASRLRDAAEDLGVTIPSATRTSAADAPKDATPGIATVRESAVPSYGTSFVGRATELVDVAGLLQRSDVRCVTIVGPGGVGKTRLALELARERHLDARFPDGVTFVSLEGLQASSQLPAAIARAVGMPSGAGDPARQLHEHLGDVERLLVLDNFEHLVDSAPTVTHLLRACPGVRVVVTSRQRLGVEEEHVYELGGLCDATASPGGERPARSEGSELFLQRAGKARARLHLSDASRATVERICASVQGLPLAIELAAAWTRVLPVEEIADEIQHDLDFLSTTTIDAPERHRSVRITLDRSWDMLDRNEQRALERLSVFRSGFRRASASCVADVSLLVLARLVDTSLLRATATGRFEMHQLLARYAHEKLAADPNARDAVERRHCAYVIRFLQRQASQARDANIRDALAAIDVEIHDVLYAAERSDATGRPDEVVDVVRLLWLDCGYYNARGADAYATGLLKAAADHAEAAGLLEVAHDLLGRLGDTFQNTTVDLDQALAAYRRAEHLAAAAGNAGRQAVFESLYGIVRTLQEASDADLHLDRSLDLAIAAADDLSLCTVLEQRGLVFAARKRWAEATHLFDRSLGLVDGLEAVGAAVPAELARRRFYALLNQGEAELRLGHVHGSLARREQALAIARDTGNQIWEAHALLELGTTHHESGNRGEAESCLKNALALYRRNGVAASASKLTRFMSANAYPCDPPFPTRAEEEAAQIVDRPPRIHPESSDQDRS